MYRWQPSMMYHRLTLSIAFCSLKVDKTPTSIWNASRWSKIQYHQSKGLIQRQSLSIYLRRSQLLRLIKKKNAVHNEKLQQMELIAIEGSQRRISTNFSIKKLESSSLSRKETGIKLLIIANPPKIKQSRYQHFIHNSFQYSQTHSYLYY